MKKNGKGVAYLQYLIVFLEGIITFISPCHLPMLPIYISYFACGENSTKKTFRNSLGFVLGFSVIFILLGALAGTLGSFFTKYRSVLNIITGAIVILFGLNFMGIIKIKFFKTLNSSAPEGDLTFFSSILFGIVFSIGWTPCAGAFLGSALMLAASGGETIRGILMLFVYSLGLGIPFILSALLIDKFKSAFDFIKRNYKIVNTVSGTLLIIVGVLMITGIFNRLLSFLN